MKPTTTPILALWLDDELNDISRKTGLETWRLGPMQAAEHFGQLKLVTCSSLSAFAEALRDGMSSGQNRDPQPFELLIIDLLLDFDDPNFDQLGFADERLHRQKAGAQIAGLIRSSRFDGLRCNWLERYREVPMLIHSWSPTMEGLVSNQVGTRMEGIRMVAKAWYNGAEPSPEFKEAMDDLLKQVEARRAAGR